LPETAATFPILHALLAALDEDRHGEESALQEMLDEFALRGTTDDELAAHLVRRAL
jgi:hypothetical protein